MKDDERRRRLNQYLSQELGGDRQLLIQRSRMTPGRISQLLSQSLPFGERAAAALAVKLDLPADYFEADRTADQPLSAEALLVARDYDALDSKSRTTVRSMIDLLLPTRNFDPKVEGMLAVKDQPMKDRDRLLNDDSERAQTETPQRIVNRRTQR
jgi:hypothetical protein